MELQRSLRPTPWDSRRITTVVFVRLGTRGPGLPGGPPYNKDWLISKRGFAYELPKDCESVGSVSSSKTLHYGSLLSMRYRQFQELHHSVDTMILRTFARRLSGFLDVLSNNFFPDGCVGCSSTFSGPSVMIRNSHA